MGTISEAEGQLSLEASLWQTSHLRASDGPYIAGPSSLSNVQAVSLRLTCPHRGKTHELPIKDGHLCKRHRQPRVLGRQISLAKTSSAEPGWLARRPGYYFSDAEPDPRIIEELAIPDNQRRK
jgi:hypothetical protein